MLKRPKVIAGIVSVTVLLIGCVLLELGFANKSVAAESTQSQMTVSEYTMTSEQPVDFEVQQIKSYVHTMGFVEIKQAGTTGIKQLTYKVQKRSDGKELARKQIAEKIIKQPTVQIEMIGARLPNALTKAKGAQIFTDSKGVAHRETYYDLPMNVVMSACGAGGQYTVREDGAKIDKDGYIIVAANYGNYPRCSVVETSMGPGKVYDTGGFAVRHPHGFDLATDWTKADGR